jgi:cell division protease FtsH
LYTTEQLIDGMCMTMGGRVAEDITFSRISTGAQNDLERITKLAYAMVTVYGMNRKVGNISFNDSQENQFNKPYSEKTAELIDEEVRLLISDSYDRTKRLLLSKKDGLIALAEKLLEKEILFQSDLEEILGKRPFDHRTTYDEFVNSGDNEKKDEAVAEKSKTTQEESAADQKETEASSSTQDSKASSANEGLPETNAPLPVNGQDNQVESKLDTFEPKEEGSK